MKGVGVESLRGAVDRFGEVEEKLAWDTKESWQEK